jgi:hypothetical protein
MRDQLFYYRHQTSMLLYVIALRNCFINIAFFDRQGEGMI